MKKYAGIYIESGVKVVLFLVLTFFLFLIYGDLYEKKFKTPTEQEKNKPERVIEKTVHIPRIKKVEKTPCDEVKPKPTKQRRATRLAEVPKLAPPVKQIVEAPASQTAPTAPKVIAEDFYDKAVFPKDKEAEEVVEALAPVPVPKRRVRIVVVEQQPYAYPYAVPSYNQPYYPTYSSGPTAYRHDNHQRHSTPPPVITPPPPNGARLPAGNTGGHSPLGTTGTVF